MADLGNGAGSFGVELLDARPGLSLKDGRYEVVTYHHSTENSYFRFGHSAYIARDTKDSKCVTITIFGKTASSYVNIDHWLSITKNPIYEADAADNIIIPSDHFWHTSEHRHLCVVSELVGPELFQLTNNGGTGKPLPADWLWKIFKEALSSLRFMHSHNIVHGSVQLSSLIIAYPGLNATDEEGVRSFYKSDAYKQFVFNNSGTSNLDEPDNLNFRLKMHEFSKSFYTNSPPSDPSQYMLLDCPPPELVLRQEVSFKTDIWYLGLEMANLLSSIPEFASLFGNNFGTPLDKLLASRAVLGAIPASFQSYLPDDKRDAEDAVGGGGHASSVLFEKVREGRAELREYFDEEDLDREFAAEEIRLAADLLASMLAYDPALRCTAEEALGHEFFRTQRLVES